MAAVNEVELSLSGLSVNSVSSELLSKLISHNEAVHAILTDLKSTIEAVRANDRSDSQKEHKSTALVGAPEPEISADVAASPALASPSKNEFFMVKVEQENQSEATSNTEEDRKAFDLDNEIARKRHEQRRRLELLGLKNRISYKYISFPSVFYQSEIDSFEKTRRYLAQDPHHWWHRLHHRRHKSTVEGDHALIGTTGEFRDELLDALFDFETVWPESHFRHVLPLRELEHTFGYKLYRIKSPNLGVVVPGTPLIIEIGRYFNNLGVALTSHHSSESAAVIKRQFTLNTLYQRCRERGTIGEIAGSESRQRKVAFYRIFNVLRAFSHVANIPEELPKLDERGGDMFILDLLDEVYERVTTSRVSTAARLAYTEEDSHFSPKELGYQKLTELGGLKILWTNLYTQHLRLIRSSKTLLVFWDVSILGQSPLFCHWPQWLNGKRCSQETLAGELDCYSVATAGLIEELQRSYRIIFGNPDGRFLERFFKKHFRRSGDEVGIVLHDLETIMLGSQRTRVDISRSSARQALKYYLQAPLPPSILALRPELDRKKHRGPRTRLNWHHFNFRGRTSGKLKDLLNGSPPYPLDFWMHVASLLELSQSSGLTEMERYSAYPIYGERLRELKKYVDKQRPKNLKQLFKDRRDTVGYWAFWAVIIVGGVSIILTLVSIAVSSAQAVAGFEALKPVVSAVNSGP